jgi:two-component system sensor histidine kinase KdpD
MGALTLEKTWSDVVEIVHGAISAIEKVDKRILAGRAVHVHVHPQSSLVWCDHVQLQSVFFQLVKNAAYRSPALAPIDVILDISEDGKENLQARVIDCGKDIPASERPHIFQTFNSLRSYGNGMGLAICKGLIAAFQGQIRVETIEDGRISFSFTIPTRPHLYIPMQEGVAGATLREKEADSKYDEEESKPEG